MSTEFINEDAENGIIAGILQYNYNVYLDIIDIVNHSHITDEVKSAIFESITHCYTIESNRKLDIHSVIAASHSIGLNHLLDTPESLKLIRSFGNYPIEEKTIILEAKKIRKLYQAKQYCLAMRKAATDLKNLSGEEDMSAIVELVEKPIFDLTAQLNDTDKSRGTLQIADGIDEILDNLENNPGGNVGIPSPFPKYNWCIGGGFTRGDVSILAARMKNGKSIMLDSIAQHVAGVLNIPVLNVDTEMSRQKHIYRILSSLSGVNTREIRDGTYVYDNNKRIRVREAAEKLKNMPYFYECVKGKTFQEHISIMRRWVSKSVGVDVTGRTNDGLILYDYLQPPGHGEYSGNSREDQILGYQMLSLIELAGKCDIPILSAYQLNRKGIDVDDAASLSNSDRVAQKANNVTFLKRKTQEEIAECGREFGTSKLIPIETRDGELLDEQDYINIKFDGRTATMTEGLTRNEIAKLSKSTRVEPFATDLGDGEKINICESGNGNIPSDGKSGTNLRTDGDKSPKARKIIIGKMPDPSGKKNKI